jgi:uncharacterized membrane protein YbhN (UPF0104 family)
MAWRERLQHLAVESAGLAKKRGVRIASQLLLLAGLVFVLLRLHAIWSDSNFSIAHVDWLVLVASITVCGCAVAATSFAWLAILRRLDVRTELWFVGIFFQAQLAKYIPGSVWQYAGRTTLARASGLPVRAVAVSLPAELLASALAAAAMSLLVLGWWGLAAAAVVVLALSLRVYRPSQRVLSATMHVIPAYAGIWLATGFGFWLTGRALLGVPLGDALTYAGAFSAAWLVGLVAIYAPGGIGVREAVLVALLRGKIGAGDALVLAVVSRAIFTLIDVTAAAGGALLLRTISRRRRGTPTALTDVEPSSYN